jgi:precorrin-3B synthase
MPAKDGLLVRLRVTAGRLSAATVHAIAEAGRRHGNGRFDLTSRGNLQMRGASEASLPRLHEALGARGLLDASIPGEAVRNVLVSPLAGLEGPDVAAVAAELERALVADKSLHALPGKFAFVIDDGSLLSLAAIPADIRFVRAAHETFAIGLGGYDAEDAFIGSCSRQDIVPTALRLARAFLHFSARLPDQARRMRDLLRVVEPEAIAAAADLARAPRRAPPPTPAGAPCPIGVLRLGNGTSCLGIGAAFGRLEASMLDKAAEAAEHFGKGEIRLTPWRALLLPGIAPARAQSAIACVSGAGFVTDPRDPRRALAACVGASGCESATTDTRADALALAGLARRLVPEGIALHVSGCAKGCARQQATPIVLVAREGRYNLVLEGTASSVPSARGLTSAEVGGILEGDFWKGS